MRLSEVLGDYPAEVAGDADVDITSISYDSRAVVPGALFFCIPGFASDGHDYLDRAVESGAVAAVVERVLDSPAVQILVSSSRAAMAPMSARFYGNPTSCMRLVGVTGTNGKTTTTFILDSIFREAGMRTGLIGTVEYRVGDEIMPVTRTTPEAADLQQLFRQMVDAGVEAASMEVSSHAIDLHRADSCDFDVLVFTNLTQDHLDYHKTMEGYAAAKRSIFERGAAQAHVINVDDPTGREIAAACGARLTYAVERDADLTARDTALASTGAEFDLTGPNLSLRVKSPLRGAFNVYNSLGAAGAALALGVDAESVRAGLESASQVPGRFESIEAGQNYSVLVDYAHTPDSLAQAIDAARRITTGRVIVVFGCGGDRDTGKRPLMGQAAVEGADLAIITSDNPRSESPEKIVAEIEGGARRFPEAVYEVVIDRREAIARALSAAGQTDTVLIAGKGHETGQQFADRTIEFDDRVVAREEIAKICCR